MRPDAPSPDGLDPVDVIRPDWNVPDGVRALMTTRRGGGGVAPFDSLNLGRNDGDPAVASNRQRLASALGAEPVWLRQEHGTRVAVLDGRSGDAEPAADAGVTAVAGLACAVLVADCLPVLLCTDDGRAVGATHAGWRGLAAGVLERSVEALCALSGCGRGAVQAWLGPCIGPRHFEVGADVLQAFGADPRSTDGGCFVRRDRADGQRRWLADLPGLARQRLRSAGVERASGGRWCTVADASSFFSFRRDGGSGPTGRMAAAIAIRR